MIIIVAAVAVVAFIAGVLVGRVNRKTVNTVVADANKAASTAESVAKKL